MDAKAISIFVDESGSFTYPDEMSPYYLVGLVLHDQDKAVHDAIARYERDLDLMGLTHLCFHAGPIIRREECFQPMNWQLRSRIFKKMLAFARQVDYRYHCLFVNKRFVTSVEKITAELKKSLASFLDDRFAEFSGYDVIKVYYDHGQTEVNAMLKEAFTAKFGGKVEFVPDVRPEKYKLFQLADLICTVSLIARKLALGYSMTSSEHRFFGGPRAFMRNILRSIKPKEI